MHSQDISDHQQQSAQKHVKSCIRLQKDAIWQPLLARAFIERGTIDVRGIIFSVHTRRTALPDVHPGTYLAGAADVRQYLRVADADTALV